MRDLVLSTKRSSTLVRSRASCCKATVLLTVLLIGAACSTVKKDQNGVLATATPRVLTRGPAAAVFVPAIVPIAQEIGDLFQSSMAQMYGKFGPGQRRAVFLKPHGCLHGKFKILSDLPEKYKVGLFRSANSGWIPDVWVRISSDTIPVEPDQSDNTIGVAIKVLDVPGEKILEGEKDFGSQDFLLQNISRFFVDTAHDFLDITKAMTTSPAAEKAYRETHARSDEILKAMSRPVKSVLATDFWSTTAYLFGSAQKAQYAKYKLIPCKPLVPMSQPVSEDPNYLQARLTSDLQKQDACFLFQVQLRVGENMPIDQTTLEWDEKISEPHSVARIEIPAQDISRNLDDQGVSICENMSFTAWHSLPEHRPVGSVNEARGIIYKRLADYRRKMNKTPIQEPQRWKK